MARRKPEALTAEFALRVVTEGEVLALLKQVEFVSAWHNLANVDKKFTAIQELPFVATWYRVYFEQYAPILCLAYGQSNDLLGLMPLAQHRTTGAISHAGAGQAEYHGWISVPEIEDEFPTACVIEIGRRLRPAVWHWRWLPPGASTRWLSSEALERVGIHVRSIKRPNWVIDLQDDEHLCRIRQRSSLKNNINKHKRTAHFGLERITDKAATCRLMDSIAAQYRSSSHRRLRELRLQGRQTQSEFFYRAAKLSGGTSLLCSVVESSCSGL